MDKIYVSWTWSFVVLVFLFDGVLNKDDHDKHVIVASSVFAWNGSCAILPCEITSSSEVKIDNYTWYYNAKYDNKTRHFNGSIVYQSAMPVETNPLFKDKVQYKGKKKTDCTILITDLQSEHAGSYQLRLLGKKFGDNYKWMSKTLDLTVSNTSPGFTLHTVPPMQENKSVTLTCSIDYYCPLYDISLFWLQDVNGGVKMKTLNDTKSISTTTTLTFVPSWKDNNKNISCVLETMNGKQNSTTIQLDVKHVPQKVQIKTESIIRFIEGKNITLECSVESSNPPNPKITWYKNGQMFDQEAYKKQFYESGRYYCEAENSEGRSKSNTVEISVLHPPKSISVQKPKGNIKEKSHVTLNCSAVANPPVFRYMWYKNGKLCFNSTDSHYKLGSVTENDSGSYECQAFNDQGSNRSLPMYLDVKYAPKNVKVVIKPDSKQFYEGKEVTFECVVNSSNPKVTKIAWHKNNQPYSFPDKKTIQINATDAGTYRCAATNEIREVSSDEVSVEVLYKPTYSTCNILNENKKKEHDQATLQCLSGQSNPKISSYEWLKDNKSYKTTNSDSLKFSNVQWSDSGYYACKAINIIGSSKEAECKFLQVQYAPKNVTVNSSPGNSVTEYTNVILNCEAKANPMRFTYTWYHKNERLQESQKENVLLLANIQISQAGEYYCVIKNDIGSNKSQVISLHVSYSLYTIGIYTAASIGSLIVLIIIVALILHFRNLLRTCRRTNNDRSESSFFVLKKANNDPSDQLGQNTPSEDSLNEQINYASLRFPASTNGAQIQPRTKTSLPDPNDVYSVVKKPKSTAEYENVESSKITQESQDDIHYSIITNLNKRTAAERDPEVEYAMLKH